MKSEILLDAIGEIREAFIHEAAADSRRSRFWLKTAIAAAAVLILCFAAIFITRLGHRTPPVPPPELGPLISEAPAGASKEENILWYHNLSFTDEAASYDSPATVDLCVFRDAGIGLAIEKCVRLILCQTLHLGKGDTVVHDPVPDFATGCGIAAFIGTNSNLHGSSFLCSSSKDCRNCSTVADFGQ